MTPNHGRLTLDEKEDLLRNVEVMHPCYGCGAMMEPSPILMCSACGRFVCNECWGPGGHGIRPEARCNFPGAR